MWGLKRKRPYGKCLLNTTTFHRGHSTKIAISPLSTPTLTISQGMRSGRPSESHNRRLGRFSPSLLPSSFLILIPVYRRTSQQVRIRTAVSTVQTAHLIHWHTFIHIIHKSPLAWEHFVKKRVIMNLVYIRLHYQLYDVAYITTKPYLRISGTLVSILRFVIFFKVIIALT